jgi:transposase
METNLIPRCCGLDVHKDTVVACLLLQEVPGGKARKLMRTFGTFTKDLRELCTWLGEHGVTHVGMESTGCYWIPVYAVLESQASFTLIVGNAQHIKNVPGRKTDCNDAQWIATLVRLGMIRPSYVPPPDLRELRDLLRTQRKLVQAAAAERNRTQNLLERCNLKLGRVASDVFGVSGLAMLRALAQGQTDPDVLCELARGTMRKKRDALRLALDGRFLEHHRFLLQVHLDTLDSLQAQIDKLQVRIEQRLAPYREPIERLKEIPGVQDTVAATIVAEMGTDMSVFESDAHLSAWAGLCPGNNRSADKRRREPARKGNVHLQSILVEAALAASKKKGCYFKDKHRRLQARQGQKRANVSIAHKLLISVYHVLKSGQHYKELGEHYLDRLAEARVKNNLVRRLERLGYAVEVHKLVA